MVEYSADNTLLSAQIHACDQTERLMVFTLRNMHVDFAGPSGERGKGQEKAPLAGYGLLTTLVAWRSLASWLVGELDWWADLVAASGAAMCVGGYELVLW